MSPNTVNPADILRTRSPIGKLVSNQPNNVESLAVQEVDCSASFPAEEPKRPARPLCNSAARSLTNPLLLGAAVGTSMACLFA